MMNNPKDHEHTIYGWVGGVGLALAVFATITILLNAIGGDGQPALREDISALETRVAELEEQD